MPKIVDHMSRRAEIVSAAWHLIAEEGIEAVTTRRIAEVTGYANGVLGYYFDGKDAVVDAAFQGILDAARARIQATDPEPRGLSGLAAMSLQVMPLDAARLAEARVAVNFWQQALYSSGRADIHGEIIREWRSEIVLRLLEAKEGAEVPADLDADGVADELLAMLMGMQVLATVSPDDTSPERQADQYQRFVDRLRV